MNDVRRDTGCELLPGRGIRCGEVEVLFGDGRRDLRQRLAWSPPTRNSSFDDEDDFRRSGTDAVWLRLRFDDDRLNDIEVYSGTLVYAGVELLAGEGPLVAKALARIGYASIPTRWLGEGFDVPDLFISIATRDDVGGEGDGVEWVITSSDWLSAAG